MRNEEHAQLDQKQLGRHLADAVARRDSRLGRNGNDAPRAASTPAVQRRDVSDRRPFGGAGSRC